MGAAPLAVYVATWEKAPSVLLAKTLTSIPYRQHCFAYDTSSKLPVPVARAANSAVRLNGVVKVLMTKAVNFNATTLYTPLQHRAHRAPQVRALDRHRHAPVSYTHLTLPTILLL